MTNLFSARDRRIRAPAENSLSPRRRTIVPLLRTVKSSRQQCCNFSDQGDTKSTKYRSIEAGGVDGSVLRLFPANLRFQCRGAFVVVGPRRRRSNPGDWIGGPNHPNTTSLDPAILPKSATARPRPSPPVAGRSWISMVTFNPGEQTALQGTGLIATKPDCAIRDGGGGYVVWGKLEPAARSLAEGAPPIRARAPTLVEARHPAARRRAICAEKSCETRPSARPTSEPPRSASAAGRLAELAGGTCRRIDCVE